MFLKNEAVKEKKWIVKSNEMNTPTDGIEAICRSLGINPIVAKLLYIRGFTTPKSAHSFIRMEKEMLLYPFDLRDMEQGIQRIDQAIKNGEQITVYGDYDVDGVTSVCTLYLFLKAHGAKVDYYIPNRTGEGYGVSKQAIESLKEQGTSLIITVDTGITANEEVEFARSLGVDFIVTDHHECRADLPEAVAVINPHRPDDTYPFKELAGVGVVFKLICAYEERYSGLDRINATFRVIKQYADLVAIGTIADVMPIMEENRIIVKYGLSMIENTHRVGLSALIDIASKKADAKRNDKAERTFRKKKKTKVTSGFIGFTLAPRINAAGRVRSASMAVELFLSEKFSDAYPIAESLCFANKERQAEENKIMQTAYKMIEDMDTNNDPVIVLDADDWHHGIIGIVSSRITEKYGRPSILVSFEGNEPSLPPDQHVGKGSGRSIKGLNLVDALCYCSDHLVKFGGHELAAGLSVTRKELPVFIEKINEFARNNLSEKDMIPVVESDLEIDFKEINLQLAESLQLLEPYGVGNPIPMFVVRGVTVYDICGVSEGKHTRLTLGDGSVTVSAMYFSNSPDSVGVYVGDKVDVLFSIDVNEWLDRKSVQMIVRDIKSSCAQSDKEQMERERFEQIRRGGVFSSNEGILPDRNDFVSVYRFIQNGIHSGVDTYTHKDICSKLSSNSRNIGYIKLKFIIMIFREMNVLCIDEIEDEVYKFTIHFSSQKANLEKSSILRKLRSQMR